MNSSYTIQCFVFSIAVFSVSCLSVSHAPNSKPHPYILPIKKDPATNVFYTSIGIGSPRHNFDVAIDLTGESLWYDCASNYNSLSYSPVSCDSHSCPKNTNPCIECHGPFKPGCTNNTCGISNYNPLAQVIFPGDLAKDVIFISQIQVAGFLSGCTNLHTYYNNLLEGLPKSSKGMIGLPCKDVSKYVQTTPLVVNPVDTGPMFEEGVPSTEYFIDVKSVKIDGHVVNLKPSLLSIDRKGNGGTKISSITRFAELQSFVYKPFVRDFLKKAADRRLKRVASALPFEACFDSRSIGNSITGFAVPTIDLVLQGGVQWTIHGANSMVMAKKNVACLAFVDGGTIATMSFFKASIVIGAHQLEEL
ncbi:Basic 7S globulin [Spatholobus suberectus]|nr:Basic 7S globulin [Spatholobus suberectus]